MSFLILSLKQLGLFVSTGENENGSFSPNLSHGPKFPKSGRMQPDAFQNFLFQRTEAQENLPHMRVFGGFPLSSCKILQKITIPFLEFQANTCKQGVQRAPWTEHSANFPKVHCNGASWVLHTQDLQGRHAGELVFGLLWRVHTRELLLQHPIPISRSFTKATIPDLTHGPKHGTTKSTQRLSFCGLYHTT